MPAEILEIHPENPEPRKIKRVVEVIRKGGIIIYPTDTVYGLGCQIGSSAAIEKVAMLRGLKPEKAQFSIMCADLSHLAEYTKPIDQATYKLLKRTLPGPFTFILPASNQVPKILAQNRKTVGFRISANPISLDILRELDAPILTASLKNDGDDIPYPNDLFEIEERFGKRVDLIIDAGPALMEPSTIVDVTDPNDWKIIREGAGDLSLVY
jgi:tRNA threonylcarbamoyl adenosine modification protein (Sua5/YciO/YrdC/YwlC family)